MVLVQTLNRRDTQISAPKLKLRLNRKPCTMSKSTFTASELPYAADAELSLSYDELQVRDVILALHSLTFRRYFVHSTKKKSPRSTLLYKPSSTLHGALLRVLNEKTRLKA